MLDISFALRRSVSAASLLVVAACATDSATAPSTPQPGLPVAALSPALSTAPVLHDQILSNSGILAITTGGSAHLADDFVVPAGETWTVAQVVVSGRLDASFATLPIAIHADAGGRPGAVIASAALAPSAVTPSACCGTGPGALHDYLFTLPAPVPLGGGSYWLAVEVATSGARRWEWHAVSPRTHEARPVAALDGDATWSYGPFEFDLGFALLGPTPVTQPQTIAFPAIEPSPATVGGTAALAGSATSGLPVAFSVAPTSAAVCTVSGAVVHYVGVGVCRIAADQAGSDAWLPAPQVAQEVAVDYGFVGFAAPVENDVPNAAKAGQAIPLRWRLTDASGAPVTTLAKATVTVASLACELGSTADQVEEYAAGGSGLQNLGNGYYQLNWKTPSGYARSCKLMRLDLGEGSGARTARFHFAK